MIFKNTAIIGLGIIGGSIARAMKKNRVTETIIGITRSDAYQRAYKAGLIDAGYPMEELETGIRNADFVILSVPVRKICALIPEIMPKVKEGCIVSDVGSTKHVITEVVNTFPRNKVFFVGGHPMAGSEKSGFEFGNHDLFIGKPYAVVPTNNTPQEIVDKVIEFTKSLGAVPIVIDAITHDRIVAGVSHVPQLASIALMNLIGKEDEKEKRFFQMAGPAFIEVTRTASSNFAIWEDILISNRRNISTMLENYIEELKVLKKLLDKPEVSTSFERSNKYRKHLISSSKVE